MTVLGIMSGTSLDGVDLACVTFFEKENEYGFKVECCNTIAYTTEWRNRLSSLINATAVDFVHTHCDYGHYLGNLAANFIAKNKLHVDLIASHGHTIFHQPQKKFTSQIGDGAAISAVTKLSVVCDFRSVDVALGGQGAPLVPIGDLLLFSEYDACLNIGGIANISHKNPDGKLIAYDICAANMALNYLCLQLGFDYDNGGENARAGTLDSELLKSINNLGYFKINPPKSLGVEWFNSEFKPILDKSTASGSDKLNTVCMHIANQFANVAKGLKNVLVTGGGAHNTFLIEKIKHVVPQTDIIIPSRQIIDFKEAIIFAFLGYLRIKNNNSTIASVTGATTDSCGGAIYDATGKL